MRIGKLPWEELNKIIKNNKGFLREEVRVRSAIGEDCSVVNFGDYECVLSTDPITGAEKNIGKLAVHINANDVASCGVSPLGILVTILIPPHTQFEKVKEIMEEIDEEAKKLKLEILGGHTEVTDAVNKVIVSCTVIGKTEAGRAISTSGAQLDDDIIVTKELCLEGTSILVNDYYTKAKEILSDEELNKAKTYTEKLSVVNEGIIAGEFGVNSMHDITEGGVLGALWEISEGSKVGFRIHKDKLPINNITEKLCRGFSIDPLRFISSGSMLITCKNGADLVEELRKSNIDACIIGNITKKDRVLIENNNEKKVIPQERDELFNLNIF